jgi:Calcineurin-like phosphoesterase
MATAIKARKTDFPRSPIDFDSVLSMRYHRFVSFVFAVVCLLGSISIHPTLINSMPSKGTLLTDPFLQFPTETTVKVVWFTEFAGKEHIVTYGENFNKTAIARTTSLSRTREDQKSWIGKQQEDATIFSQPTIREIWRHEADITGLIPDRRIPYLVTSFQEDGTSIQSEKFTLTAAPLPGKALKILLTSDHQLKPMVAANLQKVEETIPFVDAIFNAGDLVNTPDRASEWFDDNRGGAFFSCLQGRGNYELKKEGLTTRYRGGKLLQFAPIFPTIGNHEVMGRFSTQDDLDRQMSNAIPREIAKQLYPETSASSEESDTWLQDHSFNTQTYEEIFSIPGNKHYYAVSFGEIRLVVLYITNIWRPLFLDSETRGRYQEKEADFNYPENWGYGQFIFESIERESPQYQWLESELNSTAFQQAKYKIVMFHHPPHTLGGNIVPPYTDPIQKIDRDEAGNINSIRYEYPPDHDSIIRDVIPLLKAAGVQLVFYGHSHLWNRFKEGDINFLESSNVGNSYGAHLDGNGRPIPPDSNYVALGDPNGLEPIVPTISPLLDDSGRSLPYIASNDITVFSILDTGTGTVSSYRFDTRHPNSDVIKFDEFQI